MVERYVEEALQQNRGLAERALDVEGSGQALREARGAFLPSLSLEARYSIVSGNALDLGQLVNGAYGALNQLLGSNQFPTNIEARLPLTQETKLRLSQPLFALEIWRNLQLQRALGAVQEAELARARRALAAEVRTTYLTWAKLSRVLRLYQETLGVLEESQRTTEALVAAGKATEDAILRVQAEHAEIEQRRVETLRDQAQVRELLNFLRAAPLDAPLELSEASVLPAKLELSLESAKEGALHREELAALDAGIRAQTAVRGLATARYFPTLGLAIDYGVQGMKYSFTSADDLLVISFVASWNLFRGFQDEAKEARADLELAKLERKKDEAVAALELEARQAHRALEATAAALSTAQAQATAASSAFELVRTRFALGAASQLEFIDARTRLTTAEINLAITEYDRQLRWVELVRAAALEPAAPLESVATP
ncbi:MAG: TolC family protein [Myxococcota bacterium]